MSNPESKAKDELEAQRAALKQQRMTLAEVQIAYPKGKYVSRLKSSEVKGAKTRWVIDYTFGGDIVYLEFYAKNRSINHTCKYSDWKEYMKNARRVGDL